MLNIRSQKSFGLLSRKHNGAKTNLWILPMKVCFISPFIYSLFDDACAVNFGGAEVQLFLLASELAEDETFNVSVVTSDFGQEVVCKFGKIHIFRTFKPSQGRNFFKILVNILNFLGALKKADADVYVQRNAGVETGLTAFFCRMFRRKFIYMLSSDIDSNGRYISENGFSGFFYKFGLNSADLRICQSQEQADVLESLSNLKSLVFPSSFSIKDCYLAEKKYFLWVGRLISLKQPFLFLKLATMFPDKNFVMIAPRSSDSFDYELFREKVSNCPNLDYVESVKLSEIDRYFNEADLFVNTSEFEGVPTSFVQAWANGVPVVSFKVNPGGLLNEETGESGILPVNEESLGFCAKGEFENFSKFISEFDSMTKDRISKMRGFCFEFSKKHYDIKNNVLKFKKIIINTD